MCDRSDVQQYRSYMDGAVEYLNKLNSEWGSIVQEKQDIPEEAYGRVLQCTGHSKLLLNKRLRDFGKFLDDVHEDKCGKVVMSSDLQGLWELIDIEIEKLRGMFEELDVLKKNNWEEKKVSASPEKRQPLGALNKNGSKAPAAAVRKDLSAQAKQRLAAAKERARQLRTRSPSEQVENVC